MRVAIGSAWRNSDHNVAPYLRRVAQLRDALGVGCSVRIIAAEGDSCDRTRDSLRMLSGIVELETEIIDVSHGGPDFGSTEAPERMVALSKVGNAIFDAVKEDDDILLYIESDLRWNAEVAETLIHAAAARVAGFDVFAPMVFAGRAFYDIWGFRTLDGVRFGPFEPYSQALNSDWRVCEVGSVGSCLAMRGEVARKTRIRNDYCLVGWCEDARNNGYRIGVVPELRVDQL